MKVFVEKLNACQPSGRDIRLDIMKGIGIMLVVYGHVSHQHAFFYLFHMPLFFILSGAASALSKHPYSVKRRFKGIMFPYFVFSILSFLYWALVESKLRPVHLEALLWGSLGNLPIQAQQFINIFLSIIGPYSFIYNVVLWFLPCLFMADLIFAYVDRSKWRWGCFVGIAALYYLGGNMLPSLPWCLHLSLVAIPFLGVGKYSYKPMLKWFESSPQLGTFCGFAMLGLLVAIYFCFHPATDMLAGQVSPFYLFYFSAFVGSLMVIFLSLSIGRYGIRGGANLSLFRKE